MAGCVEVVAHGGAENLRWGERAVRDPGPGEARIRHTAVGLNFIDVYHRTGLYPTPECPFVPGVEAAGVVEAVGAGVEAVRPGDRVAYGVSPLGAYAEVRNAPADRLVRLPESIDDRTAAAMMLKGMTAQYLLRRTYEVKRGDLVLVHAAAGGVGLLVCQWAKHLGATVLGTVGSREKAEMASAHGCDHPILYRDEDVPRRVREITGGALCPVVYDSVGADTVRASLECLAPRGTLVLYGQSSGKVPPLDVDELRVRGSLYVTRPTLGTYVATREELEATAAELFEVVASGAVRIEIGATYPLGEAARAHRDLEARRTTGSTVLLP